MSTQVRDRIRLDLKSIKAPSSFRTVTPGEIAAAALALGAVVLTILYYFLYLAPVQDQLARVEDEAAKQIRVLSTPGPTPSGASQKQQIQLAKNSVDEFEAGYLKSMAQGRIELIDEINQLAKTDNLRLGSGIDMQTTTGSLAAGATELPGSKKKKGADALDVFPRVQFHFVVRGEYRDLRKFIRDLEGSKQYVIVESVNLSSGDQKQAGRSSKAPQQIASPTSLSLSVVMNAYFHP
jgi:hypothetical protein